jgi:hypothetical protein
VSPAVAGARNAPVTGSPGTAAPWWRSAVVDEVYLRSFADSDG